MKILLICGAGASTSLVAQKINNFCKENNLPFEVDAMPTALAQQNYQGYDAYLIAPQVRFLVEEYRKLVGDKQVELIPPIVYGRMDIAGILGLIKVK